MKRIIAILIYLLIPYAIYAQVEYHIQKGIVRSQSFADKNGTRIIDARIYRSGNNVNPAISLEIPEKGYFELPMGELKASDLYYIRSVESPKGTNYHVLYPQPDDVLEFTPNAPLVIILQSNRELHEYASYVKSKAIEEAEKRFKKTIDSLEYECNQGHIAEIKKDSLINVLQNKLDTYTDKVYDYILEDLKETDFEMLDARQQEISRVMESGDYVRLDSLLNWRSNEDRRTEYNKSLEMVALAEKKAEDANQALDLVKKKHKSVSEAIKFEKDHMIISALGQFQIDNALNEMKDRLYYDSTNVSYLCQIGELYEKYYNDFQNALMYYQKAFSNASIFNENDGYDIAICHNHLGDVYFAMSEYALAEEHYTEASHILELHRDGKSNTLFDSYLGLGNVHYYSQANFDKAYRYYQQCAVASVAPVNRRAFWQGTIGLGVIKFEKGDYKGARSDFESILNEISLTPDIDIVTLSMAYNSIIECMITAGQYQAAIDSCDEAMDIIRKRSTPKNTYVADLLIFKGHAYLNIGKIKEGALCMNEAIDIYMNILGEHHPKYANVCMMFADYFILIGELEKAEEMSTKALEVLNRKFGNNHLGTAGAHFSKCSLYYTLAEYEKAQNELDTIKAINKSAGFLNDFSISLINCKEAQIKNAQGDCPRGLKVFQEAADCIINEFGNEAHQLIEIYNNIALLYLDQLENEKGKEFLDKAQSLANNIYGRESPVSVMQQMGMGQYYINQGEYRKAFELYSRIEKVAIETLGADNYLLCALYSKLGDYHLDQFQFDKALYYYEKCYEITKTTYGEKHYFIAGPITKLGAYYMQIGDFNKGLEKALLAYDILSAQFGVSHKGTFNSLLGVCDAYIQLGDFEMAESVLADLSTDIVKQLGHNNLLYTEVLRIKATLAQNRGELFKAKGYIEEAIRIIDAIFGPHHSNTISFYNQLAGVYSMLCDIPKAIENNDIAISIAVDYYGKDNVGVMPLLLSKGMQCAGLNHIRDAHEIYDKVKNVYVTHFGDSCKYLITVSIPEAQLLIQEGYGERAIDILNSVEQQMLSLYGNDNIQLTSLYNTMADAYMSIAQYRNARYCYEKSIDIIEKSLGANNIQLITPLVGLGNVCLSEDTMGQYIAEAKRCFLRASFISANVYGSNHVNTTEIDAKMGAIALKQGNLPEAYKKFQKQISSVKSYFGETEGAHSLYAATHMNMGYYYLAKTNESLLRQDYKNYNRNALNAKEEFIQAKTITETIYGKDYAGLATSLNAIAQTHYMLHQPDSAIAYYVKAANLTINQFGKDSPLVAQAYAILGFTYNYNSEQSSVQDEETLNKAKDYYKRAIEIQSNSHGISKEMIMTSTMDWRLSLSAIYMKLHDYENAFKTIDSIIDELEVLQLENKYPLYVCYCTKANMIITSERDYQDALDQLVIAKDLFPLLSFSDFSVEAIQHSQLMSTLGFVYEETGAINEAIDNYENAYDKIKMLPNNPMVNTMKQYLKDKITELKNRR